MYHLVQILLDNLWLVFMVRIQMTSQLIQAMKPLAADFAHKVTMLIVCSPVFAEIGRLGERGEANITL